jgi:RimJ/RimL family protein N-acetyltransferase
VAREPEVDEIRRRASQLAAAYNEPHNRAMMANTVAFSPAEVVAHYAKMQGEGARAFFLYDGAVFVGDADFRNITATSAEFAILIAARGSQGNGLGTRFALLLHVLGFGAMGLERVYVSILPENEASLRLFGKVGYLPDDSPSARAYADDTRDVSLSLAKRDFERAHAGALAAVRVSEV